MSNRRRGRPVWPLQSCCQSPCHCHLRVSTNDVVSQFRRKSRPFFTSLALSEDTGKGTTRCASDVFDFHNMTAFTRRVVSSSLGRLRADTTAIPWMFINGFRPPLSIRILSDNVLSTAVGVGGIPNTTIFNNKMVNEYRLSEGEDFTWTLSEVRDDEMGLTRWKAVLVALNVWGGGTGTYEGRGDNKGRAKDEAAHKYLLANGLLTRPPLEE